MILDHVALWTNHLERLKEYYLNYFNGKSGEKYINKSTGYESYFLTFSSGSRIEIMQKPGIPENLNDKIEKQYLGLIHLSFGMDNMKDVDEKLEELKEAGFRILRGPRKTGDGYYEFETLDPDNNRIEVSTKYV